jgi:3-isopropylmalate/(R)-2-methylmalate dehydratase large subunit
MTMAEQVLARTSGRDRVEPGEYLTARVDVAMCHEALVACGRQLRDLGIDKVWDPDRVIVVLDHGFPAATERMASSHQMARSFVEQFGISQFLGHAGICHQVLVERGLIKPGELVLGTDSHSTTYGAVGAAGAGIGISEMTYVLATGELWMRVPETIRFELDGSPGPGTFSVCLVSSPSPSPASISGTPWPSGFPIWPVRGSPMRARTATSWRSISSTGGSPT